MRRITKLSAAVLLGSGLCSASSDAAAPPAARLGGDWVMRGVVTRADGVLGERRGQHVVRGWSFSSGCITGPCAKVNVWRDRGTEGSDTTVLRRVARNVYSGRGRFTVPLRCAGRTYPSGGVVPFSLQVRVVRAKTVQTTPFATAIEAVYTNVHRINRTPCPGYLGRDAGTYTGRLSTALPKPPVADFTAADDFTGETTWFTDGSSSRSDGTALRRWQWDFGDPASGADNTSALRDPSHHYVVPGSYLVTLTVTDANGLTATTRKRVDV